MVRAKMVLESIKETKWSKDHDGFKTLRFVARYDNTIPEDQRFEKATPSAHAEYQIDNPEALKRFELGKTYYVDFSPVPETEEGA